MRMGFWHATATQEPKEEAIKVGRKRDCDPDLLDCPFGILDVLCLPVLCRVIGVFFAVPKKEGMWELVFLRGSPFPHI